MAGVSTPEMAAEASMAGGVGSLGAAVMDPDEIRAAIRKIRSLTDLPFNINLFAHGEVPEKASTDFYVKKLKGYEAEVAFHTPEQAKLPPFTLEEQAAVLLEERVPIFSFTFGIPSQKILQAFKKIKTVIIGTATHLQEAIELEKAGVDFIVCQGKEAGGHRGTFIGPLDEALIPAMQLLKELKGKVSVPLIGSGGIMNGRQIAKFLEAGASAVQLGTIFIAAYESMASEAYKRAVLEWKSHPTILTRAFSGRWARSIANRYACDMAPFELEIPPFPLAQSLAIPMRQAAAKSNNPNFISLYAGTEFKDCKSASTSDIMSQLIAEM